MFRRDVGRGKTIALTIHSLERSLFAQPNLQALFLPRVCGDDNLTDCGTGTGGQVK